MGDQLAPVLKDRVDASTARLERLVRLAARCSGSDGALLEIEQRRFETGELAEPHESVAIVFAGARLVLCKPSTLVDTNDIAALLHDELASLSNDADAAEAAARARAEAEANAQRLSFALDMARTAAWELDLDGPRLIGADQLTKFFGAISAQDILDLHRTRLHPDDRPSYTLFMESLRKGERADIEHRLRDLEGEGARWVRTTGIALTRAAQRAPHYVFLTTDITERRTAESAFVDAMDQAARSLEAKRVLLEELMQDLKLSGEAARPIAEASAANDRSTTFAALHQQLAVLLGEIARRDGALTEAVHVLRRARSDAEAASAAKTCFLNAMTHELRTPLNAVINYAEMLEEEMQEQTLVQPAADAGRIKDAARVLLGVITNVLEYSDLESGKARLHRHSFVFDELFSLLRPEFESMATHSGNRITFSLAEVGCVETDWRRLRQCIEQLMSNACKFTEDGDIELSARRDGDMLEIAVRDSGCGIDPAFAPNLMSPFVQADGSLTRARGGVGLGLAITGQLARHMGGELSFESTPGHGSVFKLRVAA